MVPAVPVVPFGKPNHVCPLLEGFVRAPFTEPVDIRSGGRGESGGHYTMSHIHEKHWVQDAPSLLGELPLLPSL